VTPARLLTDVQYNNAVATLFGNKSRPLSDQIAATGDVYDNDASGLIASPRTAEALEETAQRVADEAFSSGAVKFACASGDDQASCANAFVEKEGLRVFRRPPSEGEAKLLTDLFSKLRSDPIEDSESDAAKGVLTAMLQMPGFLYQLALGEGSCHDAGIEREGKRLRLSQVFCELEGLGRELVAPRFLRWGVHLDGQCGQEHGSLGCSGLTGG